ncbi:glutamyl-Q tRNA(Asp) synthetase [Rhizobiales bacterium GAS191]|nr:glutamyl-Q tRNA(Asp) synthetase [Rhizobiales bacterium GAS191]
MDEHQEHRPVFRFAPSPNGYLHLGHALSALLNDQAARACEGRLLLRIEDIDPSRSRAELIAAIFEDLAWLDLAWETPVRRQSQRLHLYREKLDELRRQSLVYPCFCTRGAIAHAVAAEDMAWPRDPDGAALYPGTCRELAPKEAARRIATGEPHAWRLRMTEASAVAGALAWREHATALPDSAWRTVPAEPQAWGDVVLGRRDAPASYHLAVVTDDAAQGVTQVVRGQDLSTATAIHRLLQHLLRLPEPTYHHHRLVLDADGRKLSKSIASTSLRELRAAGLSPGDIRRRVELTA